MTEASYTHTLLYYFCTVDTTEAYKKMCAYQRKRIEFKRKTNKWFKIYQGKLVR